MITSEQRRIKTSKLCKLQTIVDHMIQYLSKLSVSYVFVQIWYSIYPNCLYCTCFVQIVHMIQYLSKLSVLLVFCPNCLYDTVFVKIVCIVRVLSKLSVHCLYLCFICIVCIVCIFLHRLYLCTQQLDLFLLDLKFWILQIECFKSSILDCPNWMF